MPKVIAKMIAESLGGEGEGKTLADRVKDLEDKYEQLVREVGMIEKGLTLLNRRASRVYLDEEGLGSGGEQVRA